MSHDLNPAQLDAVRTLRGPLLVLAGAGTGKTRVVTYRIATLIRSGTKPERILAVTFTKKAAAEMQQRAAALLGGNGRGSVKRGKQAPPRPEISTFHSLCVRILRRNIRRLGYPEKFVICDRTDYEWSRARVLGERLDARCQVLFSPSYQQLPAGQLANWILADRLPVRFQVQLHKVLWGDVPGR